MATSRSRLLLILGLLFLAVTVQSFAQTSRGTVTGVVTDPSGAVVPNATVTLSSTGTGVVSTTTTNTAGIYRFEAVLLGDYVVAAQAPGFGKTKGNVTVNAGLVSGHDFTLTIAGSGETVTVEAAAPQLQTEEAARGGAIPSVSLANMPITGQNSLNLMLTLPGVVKSNMAGGGALDSGIGAVNGARARSNNFMIDGSANNDISVAGPAFTLTNNDALQEVAIQTSNFTAEFGRSGGAVINQVTKSGTNKVHGTLATVYRSQVLNASTNTQRINFANKTTKVVKTKFKENIPAFTIGGPVVIPKFYDGHNKTFFFAAGQWDRYSAGGNPTDFPKVPTAAGVATLQALAATCPNVARFLDLLGSTRGASGTSTTSSIGIALPAAYAATSCGGGDRAGLSVEVGPYSRLAQRIVLDNNHLIRIDHVASDKQNMSFRWLWDSYQDTDGNIGINSAFDIPYKGKTMSGNFNHAYMIRNNLLNEFRFSYTRNNYGWFFTDETSLGATTPDISITGLTNLAVASTYPQGRVGNSFQYQDTMGWTKGKHSFRFGGEIMRQLSVQVAPFNGRGQLTYSNSTAVGISALANFIDDYSGTPGANPVAISFGSGKYWPNLFTWTLFFQDSWKIRNDLTINAGLRYENFGQPANRFKYPAFVGYKDEDVSSTQKIDEDNNNFGPSVGFSWAPRWSNGVLGFLSGEGKGVLRGGYQVSYDTWYNNLLSNMAAGSPNALGNQNVTSAYARGVEDVSNVFDSLVPVAINPYTTQQSMFSKHIRNPYYHRFSLGVQRELPSSVVVDLSYVGTLGRQLFFTNPLNPGVPNAAGTAAATQSTAYGTQTLRKYPNRGLIQIRDSGLTSNYNAMQLQVRRRLGQTYVGGLMLSSAYTWSRNMDVLTETFATYSSPQNPSRSPAWGIPLRSLDYGPADNDRRHVWSTAMMWDVRGPKKGILGQVFGGWSVSPLITITSGTPFTIINGIDRDMDGSSLGDRVNIGNPNAPITSRAKWVPATTCASRLQNPVGGACVTANDVHWVQIGTYSVGDPKQARRNQNYTGGFFTVDTNILKKFTVTERVKLEYRAEIFNLTNEQNFDTPVSATNRNVNAAGTYDFLNYGLTNGGSRTMRMGLKVIF